MRSLFLVVAVLSSACFAQEGVTTVCVGVPAGDGLMINSGFQQNQMVNLINSRGKSKKAKVKMTAIALGGYTLREMNRDAQSAGCQYIVASEFEAIGGTYGPQVNRIPSIGTMSRTSRQAAQLLYSLAEVESGRTIRQGLIPVSPSDMDDGVLQATRELGNRVFEDVTRARRNLRPE